MPMSEWKFIEIMFRLPSFPLFLGYCLVVTTWKFWEHKIPRLNLNKVMMSHNFFCILFSAFTCLGLFSFMLMKSDSWYSRKSDPVLTDLFQLYWFTKLFELSDTVYMILRKRSRQISFLHVYHHSVMLLLSDYAYRISPWPCMAFPLALNSLVHVFVYGYYLVSAFKPVDENFKKFLTQIQIVQFLLGLVFCTVGFLYHGFCIYSILFGLSMLLLFTNFYIRAYSLKKKHQE